MKYVVRNLDPILENGYIITEENEFRIISRSPKKEDAELITKVLNNAEYTKNMLGDIASFCEGRIKLGIMTEAYKDVLFLVKQHRTNL